MKQRKKVAILLVVTLVLQMMPLPVGSLAGVLDIFSVSQAAEPTSGEVGNGDNLISWSVTGTTLTLTGQGSSIMPDYGARTSYSNPYYDENGKPYSGPTAPWGKYANVVTEVNVTGVAKLGVYAFYSFEDLTSVSMSGVTEVGDDTFSNCSSLVGISLSGVNKVGSYAFSGCKSLENVSGSNSVGNFGNYAFNHCSALSTISLKADAAMGDYVFAATGLTQVIWPSGSTSISEGAFQQCEKIKTIEIPGQVRTLGAYAFNWCSSATGITGLDNVTSIGTDVFSSCNSLTDVVWSNQVTKISNYAFANCSGLTSITIPDYITEIGSSACRKCDRGGDGGAR